MDRASGKPVGSDLAKRATLCPQLPVEDGIQAVRELLPICWFDKAKCKAGLMALRMYRRVYDDKAQEFQARPRHDWT